ncbi:MAG TPA: hypothetical protein VF179_10340, partial [Thermoanaerobaculia bacterium]|nr:hypothetical protein [Thermoanaerobaculia bacterium]
SSALPSPAPHMPIQRQAAAAAATFSPVYSAMPGKAAGVSNPPLDLVAKQLAPMLAAFPDGYVRVRAIWGMTPLEEVRSWAEMVRTGLTVYGVPFKRIQVDSLHYHMAGFAPRDGQVEISFVEKPFTLPSLIPPFTLTPPPPAPPGPSLFPIQPIPPAPASSSSLADSKLVKGLGKAFSVAFDGIGFDQSHGFAKVSVKGPTVGLRKGDFSASGRISFTGTYTVEAKYGDLHFSGSLSADRWEMSLSYPGDTPVPDMSTLGGVFNQGWGSLQAVAEEAATFEGPADVSRITDKAKPHVQPILDAVTAAGGIFEAQRKRLNVGISASGPGPIPAPGISPASSSLQLTLTYSF